MTKEDTREGIEVAIYVLSQGEKPFCTAPEIAEFIDKSTQTVHNHAPEVVSNEPMIQHEKVGQASVYYVKRNFFDEIQDEDTYAIMELEGVQGAEYAEIRRAESESEFDFNVHWYDPAGGELTEHEPSKNEMGQVARMVAEEPVSVNYYANLAFSDMSVEAEKYMKEEKEEGDNHE